jgi:hypothetical protein
MAGKATLEVTRALESIVSRIPAELQGVTENDPVVGVSVVTMQLENGVNVLALEPDKGTHVDASLAMLSAMMKVMLEREQDERVRALLKAAQKQVGYAYRIKSGELQTTTVN